MALSKYNRDRPFLVITRHSMPSANEKTETKNWLKEGKWRVDEMVMIVDRVTNKHMSEATVIIDILKRQLIKNRFAEDTPDDVIKHYLTNYKEHITDGIHSWMKRKTKTDEEAQVLIHNLEDEIGNMDLKHLDKIKVNIT